MEVEVERLKQMLDSGEVQLVDTREGYEVEAGHIPGSRHVELNEVGAAADSFDRERPLVFYCRSGDRSSMPAEAFREAGFDAYNLAGGILAWQEAGQPIEPEDGAVIERHVHS
jgi:hydroxyacylglutathione hydrolase/adenylyltransferase/sulfurtransferase